MMVRSDPHGPLPNGESLYQMITRCAGAARPLHLALAALVSAAAAVGGGLGILFWILGPAPVL